MQGHTLLRIGGFIRKHEERLHKRLNLNHFTALPSRYFHHAIHNGAKTYATNTPRKFLKDEDGDSIVISGISGRFPNTDSMEEFKNNLMNGVDMILPQTRWKMSHPEIPQRMGRMNNLDKFDAEFFNMTSSAQMTDPQLRILLEVTFEAIIDAGVNPTSIRNSRTGVYIGMIGNETLEYRLCKKGDYDLDGYTALGTTNFMVPGRVSYSFNFRGPSMVMSTGCSASLVALESAVQAIQNGTCDRAIVSALTLHTVATDTIFMSGLNVLSREGRSHVFDNSANGFVRSEAAVAILIEKKLDAKRHYATIRHVLSNSDGFKPEGISFPSETNQALLMNECYEAAKIDPGQVKYFEMHGTGTPVGDSIELHSVAKVIGNAKNRKQPLLLGALKSNLGHTENVAGLAGIAKVIVATQQGLIPSNLHFNTPPSEASDVFNGTMSVVAEHMPWEGGLVGINAFGIGGSCATLILETGPSNISTNAQSQVEIEMKKIPILIPFAGRTQDLVQQSLEEASETVQDVEGAQLLRNVFRYNIKGYNYRGYGIYSSGQEQQRQPPTIQIEKYDSTQATRPLWYVFSGLGCQWNEMGKDLMSIDAFAESMHRSKVTLKNIGYDLDHLLRANNPSIFNNIIHTLVAASSVQIALLDTLNSMGLRPDGFLGHSSGEIICAYADGCFTAEEALLVNDARGRAFEKTRKTLGGMASVGMTWEEAKSRCPQGVFPACHNGPKNVSISGPQEKILEFSKQLQKEGVFVRGINTCGFAMHTIYVKDMQEVFIEYQNEILGSSSKERKRSSRWVSTSIPESEWNEPLGQNSSSAYHANNAVSPVLFQAGLEKIPKNAVVIEVAPRGLLQSILKESLDQNCTLIAPMHHTVENKLNFFLSSIGKMYNAGVDMDMGSLYPPVQFPVSSRAPAISSLVKWNHEKYVDPMYVENHHTSVGLIKTINLKDRKNEYLEGHKLDNRCFYPATGYLVHAWQGYASSLGLYYNKIPVIMENITFDRATFLNEDIQVTLQYMRLKGTNSFVIEENDVTIAKGSISSPENLEENLINIEPVRISPEAEKRSLSTIDIYKEFRLRGYNYSGEFKGIYKIDLEGIPIINYPLMLDGRWAQVAWRGNWISFLDAVLQTSIVSSQTRSTNIPVRCDSVIIDPVAFLDFVNAQEEGMNNQNKKARSQDTLIPISIYPKLKTIKCPGIEIRGMATSSIPRQKQKEILSVEKHYFVPYFDFDKLNIANKSNSAISTFNFNITALIDLVLENTTSTKLKIVDIFTNSENSQMQVIDNTFALTPHHTAEVHLLSTETELDKIDSSIKSLANKITGCESMDQLIGEIGIADLVFLDEIALLQPLSEALQNNANIILQTSDPQSAKVINENSNLKRISEKVSENTSFILLKKVSPYLNSATNGDITPICVEADNFAWLPNLQSALSQTADESIESSKRIFLYSQKDPHNGIIGLVKCLRKEPSGERIRCIFDPEGKQNLDFSNPNQILKEIIEKDLVMNVVQNGTFGSFRHIPLNQELTSTSKTVEHSYVDILTRGDLTSLRWIESPLNTITNTNIVNNTGAGIEYCNVHYSGLNFKDVMLATGRLTMDSNSPCGLQNTHLGGEYSGMDSKGNRIVGIVQGKGLASSVITDPILTWKVPKEWSMEEAATVPIVYGTAFYALCDRGGLLPGQSVLIHSGTGGVGQAAIRIALDYNCEIYTTVGSEEKRKILKDLFPTIKDENIGNSRDCSFEPQIMELTNGRGVDIVLNSLSEDKLRASVRCVALHGKFLEIGKFDLAQNSNLGMNVFIKDTEFHGICLDLLVCGNSIQKSKLNRLLANGIEKGVVKPLPRIVFPTEQIEDAFRYMASGKHIGKVVIQVRKEEEESKEKPKIKAISRTYFHPNKSYLIVGGLGGLGLEVANWMVERGAKHLVLTSRSGVTTGYQAFCVKKWKDQGVKVETPIIDLSVYEVAERFVKSLTADGKQIGGIINSGLVLKDAMIEDQSIHDFEAVAAPKIEATKNLDKLTREHCREGLNYFVVFSSLSSGKGNIGQSNYGFANSVMERICESRRKDGLPGLAIQWGVIGDVGVVAETMFGNKLTGDETVMGLIGQRIGSCLEVLDMALSQELDVTTISSALLAKRDGKKTKTKSLMVTISHILGDKDLSICEPTTTLIDLGMDSLMGIEISQLLEKDYEIVMKMGELRLLAISDLEMIESGTYNLKANKTTNKDVSSDSDSVNELNLLDGGTQIMIKLKDSRIESASNLFFVHGSDGHGLTFKSLAEKLECNVFGFQYFPLAEKYHDKNLIVQDLAREYVKELKSVQPEGPFNIVGYSAGGGIVFEMVHILQEEFGNVVENVILLDGYVAQTDIIPTGNTEVELNGIVEIISSYLGITDSKQILKERFFLGDYVSNVAFVTSLVKAKHPNIEKMMVKQFLQHVGSLTMLLRDYEPSPTLNIEGKVNLIRAKIRSHMLQEMDDEKHCLEKYCHLPITVNNVNGDHFTILQSEEVANIINVVLKDTETGKSRH